MVFKFEEKVMATREVFMEADSLEEALKKWASGDEYLAENEWDIRPEKIEINSVKCL